MGSAVDGILDDAQRRARDAYNEAINALSERDRGVLAAHFSFALIHMGICSLAEKMLVRGMFASVQRLGGCNIVIATPGRSVACIFLLDEDAITIQYIGDPLRKEWNVRWKPPATPAAMPELSRAVEDLIADVTRHLTV